MAGVVATAGPFFSIAPPANVSRRACSLCRACNATPPQSSSYQPSTSGSTPTCSCSITLFGRVNFRNRQSPLLQRSNLAWERRIKSSQQTCSASNWLWSWFSKKNSRDRFKVYAVSLPSNPKVQMFREDAPSIKSSFLYQFMNLMKCKVLTI